MKKSPPQALRKGIAKVPVVMQMESLECGAACLAMVLAYYGKWLPLERVRTDCGVSRDGSKAINLLKAARNYGLTAKGFRYEPADFKTEATYPCILHWNLNHFVVCCGIKGDYVYINDPSTGESKVTFAEFDHSFSGVALLFEPTPAFIPEGQRKSVWTFIRKRLRGSTPMFAFVIATALITAIIGIINPALSRVFTDVLLPGTNPQWLTPFIAIMSGVALVHVVISLLTAIYQLKLEGKFAIIANTTFFWHVLRLPIVFFSQRMTGDIAARQSLNEGIASDVVKMLAPLFLKVVMLVFYFIIMLHYHVWLTLLSLCGVLINLYTSRYISKKRVGYSATRMRYLALMTATEISSIEMIETVKATGSENGIFQRWIGYKAAARTIAEKQERLNTYIGNVPMLVSVVINHIILALGIYLVIQQQFTAGMLLAFQGFLTQFITPVWELINVGQNITEMRTNMERIDDVLEYNLGGYNLSPSVGGDGNRPVSSEYDKLRGDIHLKNITFAYSPLAEPLLKDFSLHITPGQRIGLVGASGCGKSTIARLISHLYEPTSGEILYDGKTYNEIDRAVFTSSLAVVDQDIILFADSISANIKMWDSSIEDFEMILGARDACLHEDIMHRDGGYQYIIAEGGSDFSGGQRQRMEIARVLATDPTVIILDEATSTLDAQTEYEVVNSIKARGITCIVIAHRLSTVRDCDAIYVIQNGQIVESGTHDELMAMDGHYATLVKSE